MPACSRTAGLTLQAFNQLWSNQSRSALATVMGVPAEQLQESISIAPTPTRLEPAASTSARRLQQAPPAGSTSAGGNNAAPLQATYTFSGEGAAAALQELVEQLRASNGSVLQQELQRNGVSGEGGTNGMCGAPLATSCFNAQITT